MTFVDLGAGRSGPAGFDLPILMRSGLLIQANSGGGKSRTLRRLAEQLSGKVQTLIFDPEGEFGVMAAAPQHTFQVLTKRAARMRDWFHWIGDRGWAERRCQAEAARFNLAGLPAVGPDNLWPLPNVWLGTSVEDQATADERIPLLLKTPAAVRFISYEPALGPIDFRRWLAPKAIRDGYRQVQARFPAAGPTPAHLSAPGIDWLIVGGESGPGARPFDLGWARSVVDQCKAAGVPAFFKQAGARPWDSGVAERALGHRSFNDQIVADFSLKLHDRKGGDWNEWPEALRVREFPQ